MIALTILLSLPLCYGARKSLLHYQGKEQLVYPVIVEGRSTASKLVLRINDDITLNLEKSEVLSEILLLVTATREGHEVETVNTSSIQEKLYYDSNERSSLMVQQTDGSTLVEGVVNRKLRIKPMPEGERSAQGHVLHSLYEVRERGEDLAKMAAYTRHYPRTHVREQSPYRRTHVVRPARHHVPQAATTVSTIIARRPVDKFVVELFIISDEEHNQNFKYKADLITYLGIMVNAMNLRYLEMRMPSIAFKLIGVTMSKADVFASHILGTIEAHETLKKLEKYYQEGKVPGNPDVVYLITNRDMSSIKSGRLDKGIAGLANVAGVCTNERVAMGEDTAPSYDGVFAMAHELGHSLGARHDPRGSSECSWRHGFLMSYEEGGTNKYRLSPCSMDQIKTTTEKLPDDCIRESATVTHYMEKPHVMPGQKISAGEHCRLIMIRSLKQKRIRSEAYAETLPDLARECKMKCCYNVGHQKWCQKVDILEGMICTEGKTCRKGVCGNHNWAGK